MGSFWLYYCALSCFIWVSLKPFVSLRGALKIFCGLRAFLCTLCDKGPCVKAEKEQPNLQRVKLCYSFCPQWSSKETGQRGLCFCCVACCFCFLLAELKGSIHLCLSRYSLGSPWPCRACGVQVLWGKQEPFRWGWCCLHCSEVSAVTRPGWGQRGVPGANAVIPCRNTTSGTIQGPLAAALGSQSHTEGKGRPERGLLHWARQEKMAKVCSSSGDWCDRSQGHIGESWKAQAKTELQLLKKEE